MIFTTELFTDVGEGVLRQFPERYIATWRAIATSLLRLLEVNRCNGTLKWAETTAWMRSTVIAGSARSSISRSTAWAISSVMVR